jgi:hypothetical protein
MKAWLRRAGKLTASTPIATLIAAVALIFAAFQLADGRKTESVSLALQFDDRLHSKEALDMLVRASSDPPSPIFTPDASSTGERGAYSLQQGAIVLSNYDTINYLYKQNLVKPSIIYNLFCSSVDVLSANAEMQRLVQKEREKPGDSDSYSGFTQLSATCKQWEHDGSAVRFESGGN